MNLARFKNEFLNENSPSKLDDNSLLSKVSVIMPTPALDEKLINPKDQISLEHSDKPLDCNHIDADRQIIKEIDEILAPIYEAEALNHGDSMGPVTNENLQIEEGQNTDSSSSSDDDDDSSFDELNRSDIFPIEAKTPDFSEATNGKKIASYLQV